MNWFHKVTGHPGSKRLFMQISSCYYHRDMHSLIDDFHCEHCQRNKLSGTGYGLLPEHELRSLPFKECAVDLIGPWIIQVCNKPYEFNALTVIDTVSNLVELVRINEKTLHTWQENTPKSGCQDTLGQNAVYTIMVEKL